MSTILLTGGAGFIGHHTVEHILTTTDHDIVVLDSLTYAADIGRYINMKGYDSSRVRVYWHDLRAALPPTLVNRIGEVDTIINMASESHVDRSINDPIPFVHNNIMLVLNMLEYARIVQPRVFIQVSTDEVYGAAPPGYSHPEWDVILPSNPYAASKAAQEAIAISYWRTWGVPLIITNTMNTFGERQHPEKFLPIVVRNLINNKPIPLHGKEVPLGRMQYGTQWVAGSRVWLHARNHADALLWLASQGAIQYNGEDHMEPVRYNVAGDADMTNDEIVKFAANILDVKYSLEWIDYHSSRPGHDMRYSLTNKKLRDSGWTPPLDFETSFAQCVRWMADNPEWL